eukprot:2885122-Prymnesium_polylepis.1
MEAHPRWTVVKVDFRNAFNERCHGSRSCVSRRRASRRSSPSSLQHTELRPTSPPSGPMVGCASALAVAARRAAPS